jgi:hypothetical protein
MIKKAGYRSAEALRHLKSEFFRNLLEDLEDIDYQI